jgi:trk system potassium uptake protein
VSSVNKDLFQGHNITMGHLLQRIPFLLELFFNGGFILFYSLHDAGKLPISWSFNVTSAVLNYLAWSIPPVILIVLVTNYLVAKSFEDYIRKHIFSIVIIVPLVIVWGDLEFTFWLASVHLLSSVLALYDPSVDSVAHQSDEVDPTSFSLTKTKLKPAQLVLLTFFALIFSGSFLLMLPISSTTGTVLSFVDAIFMATSATCVTGLSTVSINQQFSLFGQLVILILIQIGGLGIMTLSSSMTILLGKSMAMKERVVMQDLLDVSSLEDLIDMIIDIIKYTLFFELWGGIVLTIAFTFEGFEFGKAVYFGFFHSISAFCNAGFALFDNSLESFSSNPLIHGTIGILLTVGGLGFIVLKELRTFLGKPQFWSRLGLHSKIVLVSTGLLTASGAIIIFFGEYLHALEGMGLWHQIQISVFQSMTLRTAGFNTIALTDLHTHTLYLMTLYMFVGASPGSTGGGIKTTTLAILIQSIKSTLLGRERVEFFDRRISNVMVVRATALTIISIIMASFFIFILMKTETNNNSQSFLTIFFEVISASGTVGLSLGLTPYLSVLGKFAIALLMFIGRVGPLTLVLAIGQQQNERGNLSYPEGRIMIG